jgi:hypothetical protein
MTEFSNPTGWTAAHDRFAQARVPSPAKEDFPAKGRDRIYASLAGKAGS